MATAQKFKFAKYPMIFGKLKLRALVEVAQKYGMEVICASKPGMHVHAEIGLYGTRKQMKSVQDEWAANGNTLKARSFTAVFNIPLEIPREKWIPNPLPQEN